jgi:SAM-dependent methyltransferase
MRFDAAEMDALYDDYRGPAYEAARARFEPGYRERNRLLSAGSGYIPAIETFLAPHLAPSPRVLDWGGDTGVNTPFRGRAGAHHVYDISNKPTVPGAERVDLPGDGAEPYDLIVSANVLEHVSAPGDLVRAMAAAMGPETRLYVEVPHEDVVRLVPEPAARGPRKRHWHEHVNFFTAEALDRMLEAAGLVCLDRISQPVTAGGKESHVFSLVARRRA